MSSPKFKVCVHCGTICEGKIKKCPECSSGLKSISFEEFKKKLTEDGSIKAYFLTWPNWSRPGAWIQITAQSKHKFEATSL